jgi:hypothetical protein
MVRQHSRSLQRCNQHAARLSQDVGRRVELYVGQARAAGASWQTIGAALGIARQSAWQRFHDLPASAAPVAPGLRLPRAPSRSSAAQLRLQQSIELRVRQARAAGASWQTIGAALGITRQSAWQRFHHLPASAAETALASLRPAVPSGRKSTAQLRRQEKTELRVSRLRAAGRAGRLSAPGSRSPASQPGSASGTCALPARPAAFLRQFSMPGSCTQLPSPNG